MFLCITPKYDRYYYSGQGVNIELANSENHRLIQILGKMLIFFYAPFCFHTYPDTETLSLTLDFQKQIEKGLLFIVSLWSRLSQGATEILKIK